LHKYAFIRIIALLFAIVLINPVSSSINPVFSLFEKNFNKTGSSIANESLIEELKLHENKTSSYIDIQAFTGLNGTGVKIGVISDGVSHLEDAVNAGVLPNSVHVLRNSVISGDEGTAILEVLYKIAPNADFYFVSHGKDKTEFRDGVSLLVDAGCKIICDDVEWREVPYFEDDWLSDYINNTTKENDLLYVIGAGNDGLRHYQGLYYNNGSNFHDFSGGTLPKNASPEKFLITLPPYGNTEAILQWDDPWEDRENEYQLYVIDADNFSPLKTNNQVTLNKNPMETVVYVNPFNKSVNLSLLIENRNGTSKQKSLELFVFSPPSNPAVLDKRFVNATDAIYGHRSLPPVTSVGAVALDNPDTIEAFSSQGPVTHENNEMILINKPDIVGIDNISVSGAGGFGKDFYGTSASVPYIAGISALLWSQNLSQNSSTIRNAMYKSAIDLGKPGWDPVYGYGRIDTLRMYLLLNGYPVRDLNDIVPEYEPVIKKNASVINTELKEKAFIRYLKPVSPSVLSETSLYNGSKIFYRALLLMQSTRH